MKDFAIKLFLYVLVGVTSSIVVAFWVGVVVFSLFGAGE